MKCYRRGEEAQSALAKAKVGTSVILPALTRRSLPHHPSLPTHAFWLRKTDDLR